MPHDELIVVAEEEDACRRPSGSIGYMKPVALRCRSARTRCDMFRLGTVRLRAGTKRWKLRKRLMATLLPRSLMTLQFPARTCWQVDVVCVLVGFCYRFS